MTLPSKILSSFTVEWKAIRSSARMLSLKPQSFKVEV